MKGQVQSIPCLRITVTSFNPVTQSDMPVTKVCHKAKVAADHYSLVRTYHWLHTNKISNSSTFDNRKDKMERRVLKVFKQYLP